MSRKKKPAGKPASFSIVHERHHYQCAECLGIGVVEMELKRWDNWNIKHFSPAEQQSAFAMDHQERFPDCVDSIGLACVQVHPPNWTDDDFEQDLDELWGVG